MVRFILFQAHRVGTIMKFSNTSGLHSLWGVPLMRMQYLTISRCQKERKKEIFSGTRRDY